MADTAEATIEFIRQREGLIYGTGTADLAKTLNEQLRKLPRTGKPDGTASADAVADLIHAILHRAAEAEGLKPGVETFKRRDGRGWRISWESGPYEWAIQASFIVMEATGRLCEPYYSFDLCIYDDE